MRTKKLLPLLLIIPMMLFFCGFLFEDVSVLVDTKKNHVYEYISADDIFADFAEDWDSAKKEYKDGYYIVSGRIEDISKKGDTINIYGSSVRDDHIICSCPKELRSESIKFKSNDGIGVYGKITFSLFDKNIHINAERIVSAPGGVKKGVFYLLDGNKIDKNSMRIRTLNNGSVVYKIPTVWEEVEHSIDKDELGTIEGYQYILNQLPGSTVTVPESFFVCYFDNESKLENKDDKKETELIEKAIINNISGEGKGDSARTKKVNTYYGAKYNYFVSSYTDALNALNNGYHVEYIFQKNGDDGLVMYLYVYKDAKHLSDVLFLTRFLEITSK